MLRDHGTAENLLPAAEEELEQGVFFRRQFDPLVASRHLAGRRIEPQVGNAEHRRHSRGPAPQQGAHACQQFFERKRLGEIVIRPSDPTPSPGPLSLPGL